MPDYPADSDSSKEIHPATKRRRQFLRGLGIAGIATIAGCGGDGGDSGSEPTDTPDDGNGGTDPTDTPTVTPIDRPFETNEGAIDDLTNADYNVLATGQSSLQMASTWVLEWPMVVNTNNGELTPQVFSDWSVEGDTMSIEMDDRFSWHNGDPLNADDVVAQLRIASLFGSPRRVANAEGLIKNHHDAIQKTGEYSLEITLVDELNPNLAVQSIFVSGNAKNTLFWIKHSEFGEFEEQLREPLSDDEKTTLQGEINSKQLKLDTFVGSGPFQIGDFNANEARLTKYEDHPQAGNINFSEIRIEAIDPAGTLNRLKSDQETFVNLSQSVNSEAFDEVPDYYRKVPTTQAGGLAVIANHAHDIFGRTKVKQALAHITDNENVVQNTGENTQVPADPRDAGLAPNNHSYIGGEIEGELITYNSEDRAVKLLEEEGFTREDGKWFKPNGDRWSFKLRTFQNPGWAPHTRTVAGQWRNFGIDCQEEIIEPTSFFGPFGSGEYPIVVEYGRGAGNPNPFLGFRRNMIGFGGGSMQYPDEVEAPPIGNMDGDLQTYKTLDILNEAQTASNEEDFTTAIRQLAWVSNYTLPVQQLNHQVKVYAYNTREADWPPKESELYQTQYTRGMVQWMFREGEATLKSR